MENKDKYYLKDINETLSLFKTSLTGLDSQEVILRHKKYGENILDIDEKINYLLLFIEQFKSFIIYILIFATLLSFILGEYVDAILILVILIANALIGFFQELSAQKSLNALKKLNTIKAKVYRDSKLIEINSTNLTLGDIVYLEVGDKVPADIRIINLNRLKVDESALTGESLSVEKISEKISSDSQISDQKNMLFSSTNIVEGTALGVVVEIGMNTQIGKITSMIKETKDEMTPLQKKLDKFGKQLSFGIIMICILVFAILLFTKGASPENIVIFLLISVSLAVAAVPTALPAVVTIALSIGVKKLLKKKALVRKLSSVETLGSCDVICSDKTGTLTKNEMTVQNSWSFSGDCKISGTGYNPHGNIEGKFNPILFEIGSICNNASIFRKDNLWAISGDPTEAALIVSGKKANINESNFDKLDEIPFDSSRKLMSVLVNDKTTKKKLQFTKGAPNILIEKCTHVLINNKKIQITEFHKKEILNQVNKYSKQALRVLAFAYKEINVSDDFIEENLIFVGLQAMMDPPRDDVIDSIKKAKKAGIRVIMITGDYIETGKAIAKKIGILGNAITGEELNDLNDNELKELLKSNTNIFARVIPEHKQRIVSILQGLGHTVAMTGDGVNDAPALKKANIGIAVGSGTDVAKEAADFVLLDDSFTHVINAVEEGRGIYENIQKSIMLLLSGNLSEVLIIFLAVLFGFNLPLTAVLLLWINLITDGAPALAFSVDPSNPKIMNKKPISSKEGILPPKKLGIIIYRGIVGAILGLIMFWYYNAGMPENSTEHILAQTMIFTFVIFSELIHSFVIRTEFRTKFFSNIWLWSAFLFSIGIQALVMYTPFRNILNIVALSFNQIIVMLIYLTIFIFSYILYNKLIQPLIFKEKI